MFVHACLLKESSVCILNEPAGQSPLLQHARGCRARHVGCQRSGILAKLARPSSISFCVWAETFQPVLPAWSCLCTKCISTQAQRLTGRQLRLGWAGLLIASVVELEESVSELQPREKTCLAEVSKKGRVGSGLGPLSSTLWILDDASSLAQPLAIECPVLTSQGQVVLNPEGELKQRDWPGFPSRQGTPQKRGTRCERTHSRWPASAGGSGRVDTVLEATVCGQACLMPSLCSHFRKS